MQGAINFKLPEISSEGAVISFNVAVIVRTHEEGERSIFGVHFTPFHSMNEYVTSLSSLLKPEK
jgi:hypothetical protein